MSQSEKQLIVARGLLKNKPNITSGEVARLLNQWEFKKGKQ